MCPADPGDAPADTEPADYPTATRESTSAALSAAAPPPVSNASRRLRALAALSGSLTDALTPEEAAAVVERQALIALGATSAVVMTRGRFPRTIALAGDDGSNGANDRAGDGDTLSIVHAIGLSPDAVDTLRALPHDARMPLAEVATSGDAMFLHSASALMRYPAWGAAMGSSGARAIAVVPVWANGELRGVLGLGWPDAQTFDEDERAFVVTLGVMCAQAIMRAHLREAERIAREAAEHANAAKARFLAVVSHELRTPMNAVIGYTDLLAAEIDGPVSDSQREHLSRMRASGRHLLDLIEDLLAHARLEAGDEVVRSEPAALEDVINESFVLVGPAARRKGLSIDVHDPDRRIPLATDVRKLRQILVNLLANAIRFTEKGDVVVRATTTVSDDLTTVRITIADTGCGIASSNVERIFDAFWQEHSGLTRPAGGTGLGLAVARQYARLLGGDVRVVASAPGKGSTFELAFPAIYARPLSPKGSAASDDRFTEPEAA